MIEARRIEMTAVQVRLATTDAIALRYILTDYARTAETGQFGTGTSVDDDVRLCRQIAAELQRLEPRDTPVPS